MINFLHLGSVILTKLDIMYLYLYYKKMLKCEYNLFNTVLMIIVYVTLYVSVTTKHVIPSTTVTNPCLKFCITNVCKYN